MSHTTRTGIFAFGIVFGFVVVPVCVFVLPRLASSGSQNNAASIDIVEPKSAKKDPDVAKVVDLSKKPEKLKLPPPVKKEPISVVSLDPEQRAAWDRARGRWEKGSLYVFALTGVEKAKWVGVDGEGVPGGDGWVPRCRESYGIGDAFGDDFYSYRRDGKIVVTIDPKKAAIEMASKPSSRVVAIVDLFSQPNPVVRGWYRSDGREVKEFKDPPTPSIGDSLIKHLFDIQRKIGD